MYVRNGGNPMANSDLGREAHWFDGDGMLSGVWFGRSTNNANELDVHFVNQFILTDVYLSGIESSSLRTPILPSIATLTNPASSLFWIIWRIIRTVFIVLLSHLPGSQFTIKRISVANTSVLYHDGRALATCESGPPMRVTLPELETVGWFDGKGVDGEPEQKDAEKEEGPALGGTGPLNWMREWSTGHPKVDNSTGELVLFHCSFAPPYVQYSLIPSTDSNKTDHHLADNAGRIINAAVPGCTGGKLMHDFGVSKHHTVILDLPLSLTPVNLAKNSPVVAYEPHKPARYGVFPRQHPEAVRWFETDGCCIFHTANTWDEFDSEGNVAAVSLLACRLTSASVVFSAGNIVPPPHPNHKDAITEKPMSFFAKYDDNDQDPEKYSPDETSPLISHRDVAPNPFGASSSLPVSHDDEEQCRLYYYRFSMESATENTITHQFALAAIPIEFPTVSPLTAMSSARYIYGCSTSIETFGSALGKATKIDVIVRFDVQALLARAQIEPPDPITGCVDNRTFEQIMASNDPNDPIKVFKLPPQHYGQEATFIPQSRRGSATNKNTAFDEDDGYLVFYVFDEHQLDEAGECKEDARSELWVLDAQTMARVECKIQLPTRIPYGLHGNWFTEEQIKRQKRVEKVRALPAAAAETRWGRIKRCIHGSLG
jgi:carotenoid cleavage dioxygenase-like enzyme